MLARCSTLRKINRRRSPAIPGKRSILFLFLEANRRNSSFFSRLFSIFYIFLNNSVGSSFSFPQLFFFADGNLSSRFRRVTLIASDNSTRPSLDSKSVPLYDPQRTARMPNLSFSIAAYDEHTAAGGRTSQLSSLIDMLVSWATAKGVLKNGTIWLKSSFTDSLRFPNDAKVYNCSAIHSRGT